MGRSLCLAALAVAFLAAGSGPSQAADACVDGSPPQPAGGTVSITPPAPVVNDDILVVGNFNDSRPYVDGSMRTTVRAPDGTTVTFASENERYTPKQAGEYVATVTATYVGCTDYTEPRYVTDTAGPTPFQVSAGRDPKMFVKAIVRRSHGSGHGSAFLQANIDCGDSTTATGLPVKFALYYDTKGRLPTRSSPHISALAANGCQGRSSKDTRGRKATRLYTIEADAGNAQLNVSEPQRMRVLIEMTQGTKVLGAVRASFKRSSIGESVVRDTGSCAGASSGCQRFKTTYI
jgi:hypothetical protein